MKPPRLFVLFACLVMLGCGKKPDPQPQAPVPQTPAEPTSPQDPASQPSQPEAPPVSPAPEPPAPASLTAQQQQWKLWLVDFVSEDRNAKADAAEQLAGLSADQTQELAVFMQDESDAVRRGAALFLRERFTAQDQTLAKVFLAALDDPDRQVRSFSLAAAHNFSSEQLQAAAPRLIASLKRLGEEEANNRVSSVRLLANSSETGQEEPNSLLIEALQSSLQNDPADKVRSACLMGLVRLAPPPHTVPLLRRTLREDASAKVRGLAAIRLAKLGLPARAAIEDLGAALEDREESVQKQAARTLVVFGKDSLPVLTPRLSSAAATTRLWALWALENLGPAARSAEPQIRQRLQDSDPRVQAVAQRILARWK